MSTNEPDRQTYLNRLREAAELLQDATTEVDLLNLTAPDVQLSLRFYNRQTGHWKRGCGKLSPQRNAELKELIKKWLVEGVTSDKS